MCFFTADDVASAGRIVATLEREALRMGSASQIADVWRDWSRLLIPVVDGAKREPPSP